MLGVPVAALGLAGFLALFAAAVAHGEWARLTQATLALTSLFFGAYLLYVQLAVIDAICQWCLATDVITAAIAAIALLRLRLVDPPPPAVVPPARPSPKRRSSGKRRSKRNARGRSRSR